MDALETIFTRRSIRKYTSEPVAEADVKTLLDAAMNAPSANNCQPWHFIVVTDRAMLNAIMDVHPYSKMLAEAPMAIVVCGDTMVSGSYWQQDCAAATENLLLAARALDLGTVWLGVFPSEARASGVHKLFELPDHVQPLCIVAVGHPNEQKGRVERSDAAKVHKNRW